MTAPVPPAATGATPDPANAETPGIARRLAAFLYEGVLLFGVLMISAYLYSTLTQQRHALQGQLGLQVFLFLVLGMYFVWFWSHGGQTVAMKAWHLRLVAQDGGPVSRARGALRYVLAWVWFVPALATAHLAGLHSSAEIFGLMAAGVVAYALLARLHPKRQFWHDAVCGTRLITWRPVLPPRRPGRRGTAESA